MRSRERPSVSPTSCSVRGSPSRSRPKRSSIDLALLLVELAERAAHARRAAAWWISCFLGRRHARLLRAVARAPGPRRRSLPTTLLAERHVAVADADAAPRPRPRRCRDRRRSRAASACACSCSVSSVDLAAEARGDRRQLLRQRERAGLPRQRVRDRLADPPHRVRDELHVAVRDRTGAPLPSARDCLRESDRGTARRGRDSAWRS